MEVDTIINTITIDKAHVLIAERTSNGHTAKKYSSGTSTNVFSQFGQPVLWNENSTDQPWKSLATIVNDQNNILIESCSPKTTLLIQKSHIC